MSLTKMVNGVAVEMAPAEEAAIRAEWLANDPAKVPPPKPQPGVQDVISALKAKGVIADADIAAAMANSAVAVAVK